MTFHLVTSPEQDEFDVLSFMTDDTRKFCIRVGERLSHQQQTALERLMLRDWIRLIDVSDIAAAPGLFRVFRVMPEAVEWHRRFAEETTPPTDGAV